MNLRFEKLLAICTGLFIPVSGVFAAPPTDFNNWGQSLGVIAAPCPVTFECYDGISDDSIMQRTLLAPDGQEYIQLIVTGDDPATGTSITNESFVSRNSGLTGISSNQTITQISPDQFSASTNLNTGWANNTSGPAIQIDQSLVSSWQGVDYSSNFAYSTS
jgi:hypothetical protein